MNSDDLLSFKEFSPVHELHSQGGSAEININSPNRQRSPYQNTTTTQSPNPKDPLQDLIDSMSTSVNILHNEDRQRPPNDDPMAAENSMPSQHSIFSIEFYKQFFNVDVSIVRERIVSAIIPRRASIHYLKQEIGSNPDLYGPFWIVVTLIFTIAITGNIYSYLHEANTNYHWRYKFHLVASAATTIILYISFIPLALWAAFKWTARPVNAELVSDEEGVYTPSLLTLICIYGYSLGIYIPVAVLWVIQINFLQWMLVFGAAFTTGAVLIIILSPALQNSSKSILIIGGILIAHLLLAISFLEYFFHMPDAQNMIVVAVSPRTA